MKVFKFGGASISTFQRIKGVVDITRSENTRPLLIVVSALGKTTNALETVARHFFEEKTDEALSIFEQIKKQHINLSKYLLVKQHHAFEAQFNDICTEAEWMLYDKPVRTYDYYYDQIVCLGELFSSTLLYHTFIEEGISASWIDVRDLLRTNDNFREGHIDMDISKANTEKLLKPLLKDSGMVITQGFIGSTDENESTTLGREGSDYTAAVFAKLLQATSLTIWKDVDAVLNADPRLFPEATPLPHLSYEEVVELAYYGAQIIHSKTMKPLYNARIPMYVKSFLNPSLPGTLIDNKREPDMPPMFIKKSNQVMMTFRTRDLSFAGEEPIGHWYNMLQELFMKPNLIQNGAVQLVAVFNDHPEKITELAIKAEQVFNVQVQRGLSIFTIRHYTPAAITRFASDFEPVLMQKTSDTVQYVYVEPEK